MKQKKELLAKVPLFAGLPGEQLELVAKQARQQRFEKDAIIFHEGEPAERFYVLLEGQAKLSQTALDGNMVTPRLVSKGQMFGGVAVFGKDFYPITAQALLDCECLSWRGKEMTLLMEAIPKIAINAVSLVAAQLHELQDRYRELVTERVEQRIARTVLRLTEQASVWFRLGRQDLAEMTGTTLFTASRSLKNLEKKGLIQCGREKVQVIDLDGLCAFADQGK